MTRTVRTLTGFVEQRGIDWNVEIESPQGPAHRGSAIATHVSDESHLQAFDIAIVRVTLLHVDVGPWVAQPILCPDQKSRRRIKDERERRGARQRDFECWQLSTCLDRFTEGCAD